LSARPDSLAVAALEVVPIPNGGFAENCYLVFEPGHPDTILVDPGDEADRFLSEAEQRGRSIGAIWLTHAHLDHVSGVATVRQATGAPVWLHPADLPLYQALPQQGKWFGMRVDPPPVPDHFLKDREELRIGGQAVQVRHAPGHTPGHVCFVAQGLVLAGDVLFQGSIGRTDLPGGHHSTLLESIRRELLSLPDETIVYPGHGPSTTIGRERRTNPFLTSLPQ
jgi:glyoxylase-like metal-dependent hydrolase (beta-lactamase superfamily II)